LLQPFEAESAPGEVNQPNTTLIAPFTAAGGQAREQFVTSNVSDYLPQGSASEWLRQAILRHFVARLDGRTRFDLMQPRPFQDVQLPPQHHLAALFKDDVLRQRVRDIVVKAFPGRYFVIDPTGMQQFRVGMNARPPADSTEERNWDDRATEYHATDEPIETLSDGVVSFTGLVAAAVSLPHRILLIDEPEAFLHPPLARLLGSSLASLTRERATSLVVATHSAEFLMGCIESGVNTTIVRLTWEREVAGARVLAPNELKALIGDPLLRSTRALSGLFHRGVVVGESDHDRAFYDEINRRLLVGDRGVADAFFTNAQNWQTIPRIIGPLRQLGVPAAAIIDLDTVPAPKQEWNKFYKMMGLQESETATLDDERKALSDMLNALPRDDEHPGYKKTGVSALSENDQDVACTVLDRLAKYRVFVVDTGELESWLPTLDLPRGNKAKWIVEAFKKLGSNESSPTYVSPATDDVWAFVDKVAGWINDPNRAGLPAAPADGG
jgi:hypothetical protein